MKFTIVQGHKTRMLMDFPEGHLQFVNKTLYLWKGERCDEVMKMTINFIHTM